MPAASIVNGRTGALTPARASQVNHYTSLVSAAGTPSASLMAVTESTLGENLHCCEFWLPGGCNLRCRHCYVATWAEQPAISAADYKSLTQQLVGLGLIDVVVPGMEPLLRPELWSILEAANEAGARSVGITTNGTLLEKHSSRLEESSLTVLNVSVDGPSQIHDTVRGSGVFRRMDAGIRRFRSLSTKKLITNTTVTALNAESVVDIAALSRDWGTTYSAFHPFEYAQEAENGLALDASDAASAYERIIDAFRDGRTGSVVIEAEASTVDVLLLLAARGVLDDFELVQDEAQFLFLRLGSGAYELLVNLMFHPHHFIRTIRVADNGGISSCRAMSKTGWSGMGDLRKESLKQHLARSDVKDALFFIWSEFRAAVQRAGEPAFHHYIGLLADKLHGAPFANDLACVA